jgi:hypothetical protein
MPIDRSNLRIPPPGEVRTRRPNPIEGRRMTAHAASSRTTTTIPSREPSLDESH